MASWRAHSRLTQPNLNATSENAWGFLRQIHASVAKDSRLRLVVLMGPR
jgi:hypothetical protein